MHQFRRGVWYDIVDLRDCKRRISSERQQSPSESSRLRLNEIPGAKIWNEELSPFCDLTELLDLPNNSQFQIANEHTEAVDIYVCHHRVISVQMTVADLNWGKIANPGEAVRRESELLGRGQVVFGGGDFRKEDNKWASHPRALDFEDRLSACETGLAQALTKKLTAAKKAEWLAVYCRGFAHQLVDGGSDILERVLKREAKKCPEFERIFVFDASTSPHFFESWHRSNSSDLVAG